jgi:hypothetical protein
MTKSRGPGTEIGGVTFMLNPCIYDGDQAARALRERNGAQLILLEELPHVACLSIWISHHPDVEETM